MIPGLGLGGFLVVLGSPRTRKTIKFIVLSFKIKGLLNIMKTRSGRSQDSIFHEFVIVLGGMQELLDDIVASLLEVGFSKDFEEVPWLRQ